MITKGKFCTALLLLSIASFVIWGIARLVAAHDFDVKVKGHFQNYLEAATIKTAEESLEAAMVELEVRGLTEGQVSIFWENPNNNIGVWYNNLSQSRDLLKEVSEEPLLNQAIILEKQKNGLTGKDFLNGIKCPKGISIYPYNKQFFWWSIFSGIAIAVFGLVCWGLNDETEWNEPLIKRKDHTAKA